MNRAIDGSGDGRVADLRLIRIHQVSAVVDDETIHDLQPRHLEHDWPTDVLSFVLEDTATIWKVK